MAPEGLFTMLPQRLDLVCSVGLKPPPHGLMTLEPTGQKSAGYRTSRPPCARVSYSGCKEGNQPLCLPSITSQIFDLTRASRRETEILFDDDEGT